MDITQISSIIQLLNPGSDKILIYVLVLLLAWGNRAVTTFPSVVVPAPPSPDPVPPVVVPVQPPAPGPVPNPAPAPVPPPAPVVGSDFDNCVAVTLREEGGNDVADGSTDRTSRGIEQIGDWNVWRQTHPGLPADVFDAPDSEIKAIYKQNYWNPLFCDSLPNGVDLVVFDHGVLAGIGTSAKLLQTLVGTDVDGEIGPLTIAAAATFDPVTLVGRFCDGRQAYYDGLYQKNPARNAKYIHGWTNRVVAVRTDALALASTAARPAPATPATTLPTTANIAPPWLTLAQSLVGTHAQNDNAVIMAWPPAIAAKYPEMADYASRYKHDSTAWCGVFAAYVLAMSGIKPIFGATDTDKWMWADAWKNFGTAVTGDPQSGDILVFKWAGGGEHVTFYDHEVDDNYYHCTGGNQGSGHVVSTESMPMANCVAIRRPA